MKILKSYLGGAAYLGWQNGVLSFNIGGPVGGGQFAGLVSGQASVNLGVVKAIEGVGEAELNDLISKHEPSFLPFVQAIEAYANAGLAALG